jgi:hypothetical protein
VSLILKSVHLARNEVPAMEPCLRDTNLPRSLFRTFACSHPVCRWMGLSWRWAECTSLRPSNSPTGQNDCRTEEDLKVIVKFRLLNIFVTPPYNKCFVPSSALLGSGRTFEILDLEEDLGHWGHVFEWDIETRGSNWILIFMAHETGSFPYYMPSSPTHVVLLTHRNTHHRLEPSSCKTR